MQSIPGRRARIAWASVLVALALSVGTGVTASKAATTGDSAGAYAPAPAAPGTDIPNVDVKFGMRPYADNAFYVIAMEKGWFKDVGISIAPPPYGLKVTDTNVTALLLNGQLDMSSEFCPLILPTYKSSSALKCVAFTDNFLGEAILANPNLHLKSFKQYVAQGMPFDAAIHAALAPLQGKTLVGAPELSDRPFEEAAEKFAKTQWTLQVLDDSKSLVLAKSGREDFVNPEGAPIVYTLEQAGWTDVLDIGDLYKYGPGGLDSPVEPLVANVGVAGNAAYLSAHQDTVLRFLSVVWRTIAEVKRDPSLFDVEAPYLNSVAGTNLDGKGVASTVKILDPFSSFEEDSMYFADTKSVLNYKNAWTAIINTYAGHGIVSKDSVTPDKIIWAAAVWHQMVDYRDKSDRMMKTLGGKTLSAPKQALLIKAQQYYKWYDFLDAYRYAVAASA